MILADYLSKPHHIAFVFIQELLALYLRLVIAQISTNFWSVGTILGLEREQNTQGQRRARHDQIFLEIDLIG